jgi:hypothetical protein
MALASTVSIQCGSGYQERGRGGPDGDGPLGLRPHRREARARPRCGPGGGSPADEAERGGAAAPAEDRGPSLRPDARAYAWSVTTH